MKTERKEERQRERQKDKKQIVLKKQKSKNKRQSCHEKLLPAAINNNAHFTMMMRNQRKL